MANQNSVSKHHAWQTWLNLASNGNTPTKEDPVEKVEWETVATQLCPSLAKLQDQVEHQVKSCYCSLPNSLVLFSMIR